MSTLLRIALAGALGLVALPAAAQVRGRDQGGYPIREWLVELQGGRTYAFSTDTPLGTVEGAPTPNSVLTLRRLGLLGAGRTVAGSDDCPGFGVGPSCFSYRVPPRGGGLYVLTLRAWRTETPGRTQVYVRVDGGPPRSLTPSGPVTFGGGSYLAYFTGSGAVPARRIHLHTRLRPGNNTRHAIYAYARSGEEYRIAYTARANGRVGDTAMIDVDNPARAGLVGPLTIVFGGTEEPGPIELFENNWFVPGADNDGDGLGNRLERSLRTCDRVTDPDPSPEFRCANLPGCSNPSSRLCLASLRDTDHDGLRDDLELYGYDDPLAHLPLWGADPAHMDVFVELDAEDQNPSTVACEGFGAATIEQIGEPPGSGLPDGDTPLGGFFDRLAELWGQAPSRLNPDGTPGIRMHYDVGVANPNPRDDRWGAWGGGNTCLVLASMGCDYRKAYANEFPCPADSFAPIRRWLFAYVVDRLQPVGGAGQTDAAGLASEAAYASHHVHELAHQLGLGHAGPAGSAGALSNDFGNYRTPFPSRGNYRYQDLGQAFSPGTWNLVQWPRVSFSAGSLVTPVSAIDAPELCPFGAGNSFFASLFGDVQEIVAVRSDGDGCVDVDWNKDGVFDGRSYMQVWGNMQRVIRWSQVVMPGPYVAATSATTSGPFLVHAYVDAEGRPTMRIDGNADCNEYPLPVTAPAPQRTSEGPDSLDFATAGCYPGCFRPGHVIRPFTAFPSAPARVEGFAVAGITLPERGHRVPGLLAILNEGGTLHWAEIALAPTLAPEEAAFSTRYGGTLDLPRPDQRAALDLASSTPSLVSVVDRVSDPTFGTVEVESSLLVVRVRDASGAYTLLQTSRQPLRPRLPPSWIPFQTVVDVTGAEIQSDTAVGLTSLGSRIFMATARAWEVRIWELVRLQGEPRGMSRWQLVGTAFANKPVRHRPTIVPVADRDAPGHRLWLLYTHDPRDVSQPGQDYLVLQFSDRDNFSRFNGERAFYGNQSAYGSPAAVWDDRPNLLPGHADVRVWRHVVLERGPSPNFVPVSQSTQLTPFSRGPAPGYYTDYDEWRGLQWGICDRRARADDDAPPEYRDRERCGPVPRYPEPMPGGRMAIASGEPPEDDRERHPWLYENPGGRPDAGLPR